MTLEQAIVSSLDFERRVRNYYAQAADKTDDPNGRKVFEALAEEEQGHVSGVAVPGWYAGDTPGELLEGAGANVSFLVGTPGDGGSIRVFGPYAVVDGQAAPVGMRATGARLHLNSASVTELEALPRVGPTLARRIREGRPYRSVDDLDRVDGVGPATILALRPFVQP